jgi:hypothetical protein
VAQGQRIVVVRVTTRHTLLAAAVWFLLGAALFVLAPAQRKAELIPPNTTTRAVQLSERHEDSPVADYRATTTTVTTRVSRARVRLLVPPVTRTRVAVDYTNVWDRLARCESGNRNLSTGNGFYGYWQFDARTWRQFHPGVASDYDRATQLAAAQRLHAARGWAPWPGCSRALGLR